MVNHNFDKLFLASIVETSHDSIITIDLDMVITSWNKAAASLYGYPAAEAIGKPLTTLTLPKDFQKLLLKIENIKASKQVEVFESERVGKDQTHMILEVVVSPIIDPDGEIVGLSTIARDLTARRVAEKAMHDKDVLHRMIIAQEDERSRISRDLHDELGQQVTALKFAVERAKLFCEDGEALANVELLAGIAEAIDKSVDFLAWELRPALLDNVGLVASIENYLGQWSLHAGVETEMQVSGVGGVKFLPHVETNVYRIIQECLNNTHKHARAKKLEVVLEQRKDAIVLIIADDGVGFSLRNRKKLARGLGLTGMRERASLIGGTLEFESAPNRGTSVYLRVPISEKKRRKVVRAAAHIDWS
jgi:PAS domain S-box-containing protein